MQKINDLGGLAFSGLSPLVIEDVVDQGQLIWVRARTPDGPAACPGCGTGSEWVHGYQQRMVADVPIDTRRVMVQVRVRRPVCLVLGCVQTFREQLPCVLERYQRRTSRLTCQIGAVVMAHARESRGHRAAQSCGAGARLTTAAAPRQGPQRGGCRPRRQPRTGRYGRHLHWLASAPPAVVGCVIWPLDEAQTRGLRRLRFLSRDGQLLFGLAHRIAPSLTSTLVVDQRGLPVRPAGSYRVRIWTAHPASLICPNSAEVERLGTNRIAH